LIPGPIIGIRTLWLVSYSRYLWFSPHINAQI
jgi:hypothetical protein